MITSAKDILVRASSAKDIMSGTSKNWAFEKSKTAMKKAEKIWREHMWRRVDLKGNKYTEKGVECEEESITLYSKYKKKFYKKNERRLNNIYVTGLLDLYTGEDIENADEVIDIKTVWSWETLPMRPDLNKTEYKWQGVSYMDLTNAPKATIAYCLVNTPPEKILAEIRKKQYEYNVIDPDTDEDFKVLCRLIERNHIVNIEEFHKDYPHYQWYNDVDKWEYDIPLEQRVKEVVIERSESDIFALHTRVEEMRAYLNKYFFNR